MRVVVGSAKMELGSLVQVADSALQNGWRGIQSGDCVVAYSRKKIFKIKSLIEACTGKR